MPWERPRPSSVNCRCVLWREPVGGDAAGDAENDPAHEQRAAKDADGSLLHGLGGSSPRRMSRAR
jgi:hypothetical protein